MKKVSIFNEVIGPIMRGPSSSHTAASYHLGKLIRDLLDGAPRQVIISFAKNGSYAEVYRQQGSDLGFATGIMGKEITSDGFSDALRNAEKSGIDIRFKVKEFEQKVHPNTISITGVSAAGSEIDVQAKSIGGGAVQVDELNKWPVSITGDSYEVIVEFDSRNSNAVVAELGRCEGVISISERGRGTRSLIAQKMGRSPDENTLKRLSETDGVGRVWRINPFFYAPIGEALFSSAQEMVSSAVEHNLSLGRVSLTYESMLLGISERDALDEMYRRYLLMKSGVEKGLKLQEGMQLLTPTAGKIMEAEREGRLYTGGLHTRAAARALAVMHVNSSMGVVCAAPTGGAAGTLPRVFTTLVEEKGLGEEEIALAMFAASAVGLILAVRGTFAAEVAGCQVEIGAAGAMGAAAVVEAAGGSAKEACDAAAIAFQNTMGSVCDLVQGIVEIPCHTRNAVAASSAFVCADLVMGGYVNPIPLDETIDAVMSVGKMLPRELRCTALGGIALAPSALRMKNLKHAQDSENMAGDS
ncbi:MAG: L-serine ammonia-lyase, iron-sulfur-dependent, subunit alpha [Dehalococcoidia bacterium]